MVTRVNLIDPIFLCDQHLLAEHREMTRIPNTIASGKARMNGDYPKRYVLGTGHVKFFYTRLLFLRNRYRKVHQECLYRGFNVTWKWPDDYNFPLALMRDYTPSQEEIDLNMERIVDRLPKTIRFTKRENPYETSE